MAKILEDTAEVGVAILDDDDGCPDDCLLCDEPDCRVCPDKLSLGRS